MQLGLDNKSLMIAITWEGSILEQYISMLIIFYTQGILHIAGTRNPIVKRTQVV